MKNTHDLKKVCSAAEQDSKNGYIYCSSVRHSFLSEYLLSKRMIAYMKHLALLVVTYFDSVQARLMSLQELQSAMGEELDALLPSVLDRAFKGDYEH